MAKSQSMQGKKAHLAEPPGKRRLREIDFLLKQKARELDEKEQRLDEKEDILRDKAALLQKKEDKLDRSEDDIDKKTKEFSIREKELKKEAKTVRKSEDRLPAISKDIKKRQDEKEALQREISLLKLDIRNQRSIKDKLAMQSRKLEPRVKSVSEKEDEAQKREDELFRIGSQLKRKEAMVKEGFDLLQKERDQWEQKKKKLLDETLALHARQFNAKKEVAEQERELKRAIAERDNAQRKAGELQKAVDGLEKKELVLEHREKDILGQERELAQKERELESQIKDKESGIDRIETDKKRLVEEISLLQQKRDYLRKQTHGFVLFKHREEHAKGIEKRMHDDIIQLRVENSRLKKEMNDNIRKLSLHKERMQAAERSAIGKFRAITRENDWIKRVLFEKDEEIARIKLSKIRQIPPKQDEKLKKILEEKAKEAQNANNKLSNAVREISSLERELETKIRKISDMEKMIKEKPKTMVKKVPILPSVTLIKLPRKDKAEENSVLRKELGILKAESAKMHKEMSRIKAEAERLRALKKAEEKPKQLTEEKQKGKGIMFFMKKHETGIDSLKKEREGIIKDIKRLEEKRDETRRGMQNIKRESLPALPKIKPKGDEEAKVDEGIRKHRQGLLDEIKKLEQQLKDMEKKKSGMQKAMEKALMKGKPILALPALKPLARPSQEPDEIKRTRELKKALEKEVKEKGDQLKELNRYIAKRENEHAAERYRLDTAKDQLKIKKEALDKMEKELNERERKAAKIESDLKTKENDWGKKYQLLVDTKKMIEESKKELKEAIPEQKNQIRIMEQEWDERIKELKISRDLFKEEKKEISGKLKSLQDSAIRLAKIEDGVVKKVAKLNNARTLLGRKEKEVEEVVEGIDILENENKDMKAGLDRREKEIAKKEAKLAEDSKSLEIIKKKVLAAKEMKENLVKLANGLRNAQKQVLAEMQKLEKTKEEEQSIRRSLDEEKRMISDKESRLSTRERELEQEREIFEDQTLKMMKERDALEDEEFKVCMEEELLQKQPMFKRQKQQPEEAKPRQIKPRMPKELPLINVTGTDMSKMISKTRALIREGRFDEADATMPRIEAAYRNLSAAEKRKIEYDLMELRTDIELATLR